MLAGSFHQKQVTACALIEEDEGTVHVERRQFGTFKRDRRDATATVSTFLCSTSNSPSSNNNNARPGSTFRALSFPLRVISINSSLSASLLFENLQGAVEGVN
ncbi:MAG: hypothetical protein LBC91_02840 [Candidatus Accumulibacter sp.]|nr:hypothetical protein [Accumulibacter sp.]